MKKLIINKEDSLIVRKRAKLLAKSIQNAKMLGLNVDPNEPIEGKMFW